MIEVTAGIIEKDGMYLIAQRKGGILDRKWEFPGGEIEKGESPEGCLYRELKEELRIETLVKDFFGESIYPYDLVTIRLLAYWAEYISGEVSLKVHYDAKWVYPNEMGAYTFCPADLPFIEKLINLNSGRIMNTYLK